MHNAPLYPVFHGSVWELAAAHQVLVALDELQFARQQSILLGGADLHRAQIQLHKAECDLLVAKSVLLKVLGEFPADESIGATETIQDIEAFWESNLIHPELPPTALPHISRPHHSS